MIRVDIIEYNFIINNYKTCLCEHDTTFKCLLLHYILCCNKKKSHAQNALHAKYYYTCFDIFEFQRCDHDHAIMVPSKSYSYIPYLDLLKILYTHMASN